jgi:alanyl-tRNA synthetase
VARHDFRLLRETAEKLNCAPEDIAGAATRALTERDAHFKSLRSVQERLAEAEAVLALQATPPAGAGLRIYARLFAGVPTDYLGFFATAFTKSDKSMVFLATAEGGHLLFAQHVSAGMDMNAHLKQVLEKIGGKGGGTRDFARGRLTDESQAEKAVSLAKELLSVS